MLTTIRRSPVVIVRNFFALQFCVAALYLLAGSLAYYAYIWRGLPLIADYVPFQVAQGVTILLGESLLMFYIFFSWHRDTIHVSAGQLVHNEGIIFRRHHVVSMDRIASITYTQGVFGRLANFGTVMLHDGVGSVLMRLTSIAEPQEFTQHMHHRTAANADADPLRLVMEAEHERLERKATLRWDLKTNTLNRALEKATIKTIAAFLNGTGGHVLVGVGDDGSAVGLQHDWATLARRDRDGWETHFSNLLAAMIGPSFRQYVQVRHFSYSDLPCALVAVTPAPRPAYVTDDGKEEFFIRAGNGTVGLKLSEAHTYITGHFS